MFSSLVLTTFSYGLAQILQGLEDRTVPPEQAELIVAKLRARGGHVEYVLFEGEGHGWVKAETVKKAIETELAFYERVFKISGIKP